MILALLCIRGGIPLRVCVCVAVVNIQVMWSLEETKQFRNA